MEARAMIALALPVVTDQIGMMSMGFVDTIMVGRLGKESLGAVGIGVSVYFFYMIFAFGVISAVGPTVAHAFGAGDKREISRSVGQAFWVALALSAMGLVVVWNMGAILRLLGQPPELIPLSERFIHAMGYGQAANLLYAVLRAFTVGLGRTRVTMVIAIGASILNIVADYVLIYGKLGCAPLGVAGAGYATSIVQWGMLGSILWYVLSDREIREYRFLREIFPLDFPRLG
ncbi:MAG: MATE family efflux transporter, partial [Candidatus Kapaibacterium sp.]